GRARQIDAVLAIDVLGVSRAVPAGRRRGASPHVFDSEVGLRLFDDGRTLGRDLLGLRRLVLLLVVVLGLVLVLPGIVLGRLGVLRRVLPGRVVVLLGLVLGLVVVLRRVFLGLFVVLLGVVLGLVVVLLGIVL